MPESSPRATRSSNPLLATAAERAMARIPEYEPMNPDLSPSGVTPDTYVRAFCNSGGCGWRGVIPRGPLGTAPRCPRCGFITGRDGDTALRNLRMDAAPPLFPKGARTDA